MRFDPSLEPWRKTWSPFNPRCCRSDGSPDFSLLDTDEHRVTRADFAGRPLLVAFICNHCPFVKHIADEFARFARDAAGRGLGVVAINSNDIEAHPDDAPPRMREEKRARGYEFPVPPRCHPGGREGVSRRVHAGFLFVRSRSPPGLSRPIRRNAAAAIPAAGPTGHELRAAVDALLSGGAVSQQQVPSIGCNIKWKPGNAPEYFGA
jgi:thiol-disulfide isomerase/thioredoxin